MTGRVLLDDTGLKVSPAGVEVTTAAASQLNFDSDYASLGMILQGEASPSWVTVGAGDAEWDQTIPFAETFSTPPLVVFDLDLGSGNFAVLGPSGLYFEQDATDGTGNYWNVLGEATTTGLVFKGYVRRATGSPTAPSFTVRYTVFAYHY